MDASGKVEFIGMKHAITPPVGLAASGQSDEESKNSSEKKEERRPLAAAREHVDHMLERIRKAHQSGKRKKASRIVVDYLQSFDARLVATETAWRKLDPDRRPARSTVQAVAHSVCPWTGTDEEVILRLKEKANKPHDFRLVLSFGIENRSLQYLIKPILEAQADLHPYQYGQQGVSAAIARVAKLMEEGHLWAAELDIKDCFGSFNGTTVEKLLPIPEQVTRNVVLGTNLNLKMDPYWWSLDQASADDIDYVYGRQLAVARRGFPQGSACSSIAVEMLSAPLLQQVPACGAAVAYVDNYLLMAQSEDELLTVTTALSSAFQAHPAGSLGSNELKSYKPGDAIEFLGHELRFHHGEVLISPSAENLYRFNMTLHTSLSHISKMLDHPKQSQRVAFLRSKVRSWQKAFGMCTDIQQIIDDAMHRIEKIVPHGVM